MDREQVFKKEKELVTRIFGIQYSEIPDIPKWVTNNDAEYWAKNLFFIHYIPQISLDECLNLPEWHDKPSRYFYKKIKEGKLKTEAKILSGKWILIDGRDKPAKRVPWINAKDMRIFQKMGFNPKNYFKKWKRQIHRQEYLADILKEKGFGSRFCLDINEVDNLKPFILDFLRINSQKIIRFPFFAEYNYLGNTVYKQWRTTETWEWLEDKLDEKYNLASGSRSVSCMAWDPPDFWSTILTFRPVIGL